MSTIKTISSYTIPNTGATKNVTLADDVIHYITPTVVTIAADMNFTTADTPKKGNVVEFLYNGGVESNVSGGISVNFFGVSMTDAQALYGARVTCFYNGSTWLVHILSNAQSATVGTDQLVNLGVTNAKIADATIAIAKMQALAARGNIVRAGAAGVWEELAAKTSGYILGGDGTDIRSLPTSGDVTFAYSGGYMVSTIGAGKVTPSMLSFSLVNEELEVTIDIATASILTANGTPVLLVGAPGAGYGIEVIHASITLTYVSAAYATNTVAQLITDTATVHQKVCNDILLSTVTRTLIMDDEFTIGATDTMVIANKGLYFKVKTGNPTAGDSDIKVRVRYRIIPM